MESKIHLEKQRVGSQSPGAEGEVLVKGMELQLCQTSSEWGSTQHSSCSYQSCIVDMRFAKRVGLRLTVLITHHVIEMIMIVMMMI